MKTTTSFMFSTQDGTYNNNNRKNKNSSKKVNKYLNLQHINRVRMTKKDVICFDDSNSHDEYFSLCLDSWESLPFTIDINLRVSIGRSRAGENIRVFIQKDIKTLTDELIDSGYSEEDIESFLISEKEPKITDNMISFNRRIWLELRRVRGDQLGLPLEVNKNGTLHIGERADEDNMLIFGRRKK